jgi:hypothetical protein
MGTSTRVATRSCRRCRLSDEAIERRGRALRRRSTGTATRTSARRDTVQAFHLTNGLLTTTPTSQSARRTTVDGHLRRARWGTAISANGNTSGILWAMQSQGDSLPGAPRLRRDQSRPRALQQRPGGPAGHPRLVAQVHRPGRRQRECVRHLDRTPHRLRPAAVDEL